MKHLEVDFIQDFIRETVDGLRPCEIKTLIFRDGGVELSPGNIAPAIIPEWLKDQELEITVSGGNALVKTECYGEYSADILIQPATHNVTFEHDGVSHTGNLTDNDSSHKMTIKIKGKLKDGDSVVVAKYSGMTKYLILAKMEK